MSIGTLLAYTIVSASVIVLRYKAEPQKENKDNDDVCVSSSPGHSDTLFPSEAGRLKHRFRWLSCFSLCGNSEFIFGTVAVFICSSAVLCIYIHVFSYEIADGNWWAVLILLFLTFWLLGCLLIIGAHKQNPPTNTFRVPGVPFIPALSILCNVKLMVHLNTLTWVRFTVWMIIGLLVYFLYGIKHSKESDTSNAYLMLITSPEANKEPWGTMNDRNDSTNPSASKDQSISEHTLKKLSFSGKKADKAPLTADYDSDQ